jgi:hypothetical protein
LVAFGDDPGDRAAVLGDDNILAGLHGIENSRKAGFGFCNADCSHGVFLGVTI